MGRFRRSDVTTGKGQGARARVNKGEHVTCLCLQVR